MARDDDVLSRYCEVKVLSRWTGHRWQRRALRGCWRGERQVRLASRRGDVVEGKREKVCEVKSCRRKTGYGIYF